MPFGDTSKITIEDRLPYDRFRCQGTECECKDTCLRHIELRNMGPMTAQVAHACTDTDVWFIGVKK